MEISQTILESTDPRYLTNLSSVVRVLSDMDVDLRRIEELYLSPDHTVYAPIIRTIYTKPRYRKNYKNHHFYHLVQLVLEEEDEVRIYVEGVPYQTYYKDRLLSGSSDVIEKKEKSVEEHPLVRLHTKAPKETIEDVVSRINRIDGFRVMNYSLFSDPIGGSIDLRLENNKENPEVVSDSLHSLLGDNHYLTEFVSYSFIYDSFFWKDYRLTHGGIIVDKHNRHIEIERVLDVLRTYPFSNIQVIEAHAKGWKISFETRCLYASKLYKELWEKGIPVYRISCRIEQLFNSYSFEPDFRLVPVESDEYYPEESIMGAIMNGNGEYYGF